MITFHPIYPEITHKLIDVVGVPTVLIAAGTLIVLALAGITIVYALKRRKQGERK